jgi:KDO2-lipid IV(A) lauroyltransferase
MAVTQAIPRSAALSLWGALGAAAFALLPATRRRALDNLAAAFPEQSARDREMLARRVFTELARNVAEAVRIAGARPGSVESLVEAEGWERFEEACRPGAGVIVLTGHIGCWEMLGAYICARGSPLRVLARPIRDRRLDRVVSRLRSSYGARALDPRRGMRSALAALRRGEIVGILLDMNTGTAGVLTPFFGRPAWTPVSAAWLAMRSGAAVVPMAIGRRPDGRHAVRVMPPLDLPRTGDERGDLAANTAACTAAIEGLIRHDPSQWVWFHPRWRGPSSFRGAAAAS